MPGPAVYVVFAVFSAVATGYVFKEFVYDPHIAPRFRNWRERRKRRFHGPVPATPENRSPRRSPTRNPSGPIELDTVIASEVDEWRTSANMRRRQSHNLDDIPNEVASPLLSPSTPLARSPPHVPRSSSDEAARIHLSQPLSSPAALPIPNLASFATDVDYTASSVDVTPIAQTALLQSNLTSPRLTSMSPFSDVFELAQSRISEVEIVRAGSGSDDEVFSVPSSMSSVTAADDEDDNGSLGSEESWHEIRNEFNRS